MSCSPASSPAQSSPYAGSESCAECHEQAYDEWKSSHHANAQRDFAPELDDEAFVPRRMIRHASQTSFAEARDGRHLIVTMGRDGQQHVYEPTGVIGVDPLWQYLVPQPGGRLQVTELAYDPARKEWFNVYGDEDRQYWEWGHWSNRGMNWNAMCATCHTTDFRKNYDPQTDSYRSTYLEQGVGCEQCHGPLRAHVDWQEANPDQEGDPTIPELDRDHYLSICGTCHARRGDLGSHFRPGDDLLDHYEPFLPDPSNVFYPDGQVWEEDFEYVAFSLSYMCNWGVRCTDCHYWHAAKVATREDALCLRCHERGISTKRPIDAAQHSHHPPDKPGFKCVDCHMPQTVYMARHWRHDHGMTIPDPLLTKEHGIPNACTRCHQDEGLDWSIDYVEQWYGDLMERPTRRRARLLARAKAGDLGAVPEILALLPQEDNPNWRAVYAKFLSLAIGAATGRETGTAVAVAMLGLLEDDSPLVRAAAIEALQPLVAQGLIATAAVAAKVESPHRLVRIKAAWALRDQLDLDSPPGRDLLAWLHRNQDQPAGAFQWANLYADTGRAEASLAWYEKAIRWDPGSAPFRYNYAVVLAQLGRPHEATAQLVLAARTEPQQALYPYSLGLLYAEVGRPKEARDALRRAVGLDPAHGRYWYNLALAEFKLGRIEAATEAIRKAEELEPHQPQYPYTRAAIHYEDEQYDRAREALERTLQLDPNHPGALELMGRP